MKCKIEELQKDFEDIQQQIMDILDEKGVKFKKFKRAISSFPNHVQMNSFTSLKTVSGEVEIDDIFSNWNTNVVWSFLDFSLLEHIVKRFGSDDLKASTREYSRKLSEFQRRTTVVKLMEIWPDQNQPDEYENCKKMILDLHLDPDVCTLKKLEDLRRRSCKLLKGILLSEAALVLFKLKYGSLTLIWIVCTGVVQNFKEALHQCVQEGTYFKENDIITLELDGEIFMSMERVNKCMYMSFR